MAKSDGSQAAAKSNPVSLRLAPRMIETLRKRGAMVGLGWQTLLKHLILDGLTRPNLVLHFDQEAALDIIDDDSEKGPAELLGEPEEAAEATRDPVPAKGKKPKIDMVAIRSAAATPLQNSDLSTLVPKTNGVHEPSAPAPVKYLTDESMLKAAEWVSNFDGDLPLTGRPPGTDPLSAKPKPPADPVPNLNTAPQEATADPEPAPATQPAEPSDDDFASILNSV